MVAPFFIGVDLLFQGSEKKIANRPSDVEIGASHEPWVVVARMVLAQLADKGNFSDDRVTGQVVERVEPFVVEKICDRGSGEQRTRIRGREMGSR